MNLSRVAGLIGSACFAVLKAVVSGGAAFADIDELCAFDIEDEVHG